MGFLFLRTRPLVAPSCVLFPVTLNATLFGVLLLTSRAAAVLYDMLDYSFELRESGELAGDKNLLRVTIQAISTAHP